MTVYRDEPKIKYRRADGKYLDTTLDRVQVAEIAKSIPVRDFRSYKGRKNYSGLYWSSKMMGHVAYESLLEKKRILLADFDESVSAIAAQPFLLCGEDGGRIRKHVPDLMLVTKGGIVTVVDVKPARRLHDPEVVAVFGWTERLIARRGWAFEIWTGADEMLLKNVRYLARYARRSVIRTELLPIAVDLSGSCRTIGELEHALSKYADIGLARPAVLHLLWTRTLRAPLDAPLQAETPIFLGNKG
ncbi:TnsA-like heteromeric transposase endonuclease subunit [Actinoplanes sp. NPDC020271]|uniref:TnsA-like heteromeric transposase endonuclease subunit n=1 Tax=Actinoplanes sp. NPDC020271 TaxID=3363896 RepID=UPI0037B69DFE